MGLKEGGEGKGRRGQKGREREIKCDYSFQTFNNRVKEGDNIVHQEKRTIII